MLALFYSLIGNDLIAVGSLRHNAVNLHKTLVIIIRQLALLDLVATAIMVVAGLVLVFEMDFAIGDFSCGVIFFTFYAYYLTSSFLMAMLSTSAFLNVRFAYDSQKSEAKLIHVIVFVISLALWMISMVLSLEPFLEDDLAESWSFECDLDDYHHDGGKSYIMMLILTNIWNILSTTLCASSWMGVPEPLEAEKRRDVKTVTLLSFLHCISLLPAVISLVPGGPTSQLFLLLPQHLLVSYKFVVISCLDSRFQRYLRSTLISLTSHCHGFWRLVPCCDGFHEVWISAAQSKDNLIAVEENAETENTAGIRVNGKDRKETIAEMRDVERAVRVDEEVAKEAIQKSQEGVNLSKRLVLDGQGTGESPGTVQENKP